MAAIVLAESALLRQQRQQVEICVLCNKYKSVFSDAVLKSGDAEHLRGLLDFPVQPRHVLPFYSTKHESIRLETHKLIRIISSHCEYSFVINIMCGSFC